MNIGRNLQEHRERRSITLRQIADSTKLSTTTLECIERNEFGRLPGGIFIRAYLRSFAIEVGADPDEVVDAYTRQVTVVSEIEEPPPARTAPAIKGVASLAAAAVAVVLALVVYRAFAAAPLPPQVRAVELLQSRPIVLLVSQHPGAVASLRLTGASARVTAASVAVKRPERGVRLEIRPTEPCWVSARADGKRVVRRLIRRGERVTIVAREHVFLYVGKTNGFAYTLNGAAGRPLGEAVKPVTVRITADNYTTFQAVGAGASRAVTATTN